MSDGAEDPWPGQAQIKIIAEQLSTATQQMMAKHMRRHAVRVPNPHQPTTDRLPWLSAKPNRQLRQLKLN